ncbi:MAG: XRE family transcriptional regulator [Muribaculaceae bacterium]
MIHIGKLIHEELLRQGRTPAWLARRIHCQRPNVYYIFKHPTINTEQLLAISRALSVNLFSYYTNEEVFDEYPEDDINQIE